MQSLRKKLCSGAYGGLKDLQSVATRIAARREISGLSGGFVARESSWVAPVLGSGVPGAPSRVERRNSGLGKTKAEPIAVTEAWRIGGVRRMGITTRPGDRAAEHGVRSPLTNAEGSPEWIEVSRLGSQHSRQDQKHNIQLSTLMDLLLSESKPSIDSRQTSRYDHATSN